MIVFTTIDMSPIELRQFLRQAAMRYGLLLAAYLILHMLVTVAGFNSVLWSVLSFFMLLSVPFVLFFFWVMVRKQIDNARIAFGPIFVFAYYTVFFASLLFTLVQWVYVSYIDANMIATMTSRAVETLTKLHELNPAAGYDTYIAAMQEQPLTASNMAFSSMWMLVVVGFVWALLVAAVASLFENLKKINN
ncbi:MAG: DUF4199 domain-containing protein [Paludibacteraceae bacterium]|nr:DUF4199 domain-containing protein [Paludibacteraceae bacterium]